MPLITRRMGVAGLSVIGFTCIICGTMIDLSGHPWPPILSHRLMTCIGAVAGVMLPFRDSPQL